MRRTVSLIAAAGALIALGGVAGATTTGLPVTTPELALPGAGLLVEPAGLVDPAGLAAAVVGTVEPVAATIGYADRARSRSFHYPGAEYVKVHLAQLRLLPGDYVAVADPRAQEVHRYEASGHSGESAGQWAMSVTGDTAVVTLHTAGARSVSPSGAAEGFAELGVRVDRVARGGGAAVPAAPAPTDPAPGPADPALDPVPSPAEPDPGPGGREETVCGRVDSRDAVCYRSSHPAVYHSSKAVVRLLINGVQLCTAFRVGSTNRLLTNNHCLETTRDVRNTEVWFDYQCAECGGWAVFRPTKVMGRRVLATHRVLDFTLFTVDDFRRVRRYGHLELEPRRLHAGDEIYIPQHPAGAPGQVAMRSDVDPGGACVIGNPQVHGYGWHTDAAYYCDTQAGSSGSPVISRDTHQVVALHHFGGCPNGGVRMELIYPHLAPHL